MHTMNQLSTDQPEEEQSALASDEDIACLRQLYPSRQVAAKHSSKALEKIEELKVKCKKRRWGSASATTDMRLNHRQGQYTRCATYFCY